MTMVATGTTFLHRGQGLVGYLGAGQDRAEFRKTRSWAEGPEQEENFEATLRVIIRFSAALFVTQSAVCGPASTLSPGSLEGRVSGPISDLMN